MSHLTEILVVVSQKEIEEFRIDLILIVRTHCRARLVGRSINPEDSGTPPSNALPIHSNQQSACRKDFRSRVFQALASYLLLSRLDKPVINFCGLDPRNVPAL